MEPKTKTLEGSHKEWGDIWNNKSKEKKKYETSNVFCRNEPQNIYQFWQKAYYQDLKDIIVGKGYSSFLELGAGRGTTSMYLTNDNAGDITMVDLSEEGFDLAKENFTAEGLKIPNMVLADVQKTGLQSDNYDCIYNIGLLEHFNDPKPTLQEAYRLLRKGGVIFMPIVPMMPLYKSMFLRLFLNPIGMVKLMVFRLLKTLGLTKKGNMIRTEVKRGQYLDIVRELGFKNAYCIPYNPYHKVNNDGWFESKVTLPLYKAHYRRKLKHDKPSLRTSPFFELCYLLVAYK